jgi:hypothetical protein
MTDFGAATDDFSLSWTDLAKSELEGLQPTDGG